MDESIRKQLLNKVSSSVGLLVNADAIEPQVGWPRRFDSRWKAKDEHGFTRIKPSSCGGIFVDGSSERFRRHTGILLRNDVDDNGVVYVATAAHCVPLDEELLEGVRLVLGRLDMDEEFDERFVVRLGLVKHYENMVDRDLVIFAAKGSGKGLEPMPMPRDSLDPEVVEGRAEVYVVGHAGGRRLEVIPGRVVSMAGPAPRPRGLNISAPGGRRCLSGAPVFQWSAERGASVLGVVQGRRPDKRRFYARLLSFVEGDDDRVQALAREIHDAVVYAELLHRHGAVDARAAAALRGGFDASGVPKSVFGPEVNWRSPQIDADAAVRVLRNTLRKYLTRDQVRVMEDMVVDPDQCDDDPPSDTLNVTLIHGAPSLDFMGDHDLVNPMTTAAGG